MTDRAGCEVWVTLAVEGALDEMLLRHLLAICIPDLRISAVFGLEGKDYLRQNMARYNAAAAHGVWVVLADLNHEATCAPALVRAWLPERHSNLGTLIVPVVGQTACSAPSEFSAAFNSAA